MSQPRSRPRPQASPRRADGHRARTGLRVGPVQVTVTRVVLAIALVGGLAFLAYAVVVRDQLQVPLMASGFAIVGLVFAAIAIVGAANVIRAGREGRDGFAFASALGGGVAGIVALMCLAAALVMALIWRSNA